MGEIAAWRRKTTLPRRKVLARNNRCALNRLVIHAQHRAATSTVQLYN